MYIQAKVTITKEVNVTNATTGIIGKIFMSSDMIIKVSADNGSTVSGYDLITEKFCVVPKQCLMVIPKSVLALLTSERAKVLIVKDQCKTTQQMADMLQVSVRTIYRMVQAHCGGLNRKQAIGFQNPLHPRTAIG